MVRHRRDITGAQRHLRALIQHQPRHPAALQQLARAIVDEHKDELGGREKEKKRATTPGGNKGLDAALTEVLDLYEKAIALQKDVSIVGCQC